ncbi:hypothetical protein JCGZ_01629 [Jatropha curcas]|uniref:Uncharacterized protein n=1 Tax=Jatropha curcas TaxID=180498 RepID=A0A067LCU0_JATCU|nr:hypothetical protein JCGZ_01629 [Jatropha curcas]
MFNNDQQSLFTSSMNPRISFSSDFAESQEAIKYERKSYREAPVSSDFEFSVPNYSMIPADEIFCKGMILPLKENCTNQLRKMTLRDELLVDDEDEDEFDALPRVHKSSVWWKERLSLKRSTHIVCKKGDRNNIGVLQGIVEEKTHVFVHGKNTGIVD